MHSAAASPHLLLLVLLLLSFYSAPLINAKPVTTAAAAGKNPFTPQAYVIRYWQKQVSNNLPKPSFLLDKASPLTAADYAAFSKLADQNSLSTHLPDFCTKANLLCFPDVAASLEKHSHDGKSSTYLNENRGGGADSFPRYSKKDVYKNYNHDPANPVTVGFTNHGVNTNFKYYQKEGVTSGGYGRRGGYFKIYQNGYVKDTASNVNSLAAKGKKVNLWVVEPGTFFREEMLKSDTIMPMPDIHDKMPKRSFLPRVIVSKLPFSTAKLVEMKKLFHASDDSTIVKMMTDSLSDCERAPSPGEVKRCVASIEDMIDFATSVLGRNVAVRSTDNIRGSKGNIMIGKVKRINGGKVTMSVSCHQSLYPYMIYYCHSIPKVRVYEADILDPTSKAKINHGVAICHLDTSSWSPGHEAFIALGSKPGKIEVCHWIFENHMIWTIAD